MSAPPLFDSVADCALELWPLTIEPNWSEVGDSASAPGASPVPLKAAVAGLDGKLPATLSAPDRAPAADGVKVTETVQEAPAASELPQVFAETE